MVCHELRFAAICLPALLFTLVLSAPGDNATTLADNSTHCRGVPSYLTLPKLRPAAPTSNLTVVLMNWQRPMLLRRLLDHLVHYRNVDCVVVLQCHPHSKLNFTHGKVLLVDAVHLNNAFSLATRFLGCLMTPNEWCLVMDDDIMLTEAAIEELRQAKAKEPDRLHGYFGRDYDERLVYDWSDVKPGPVRIILTKAAMYDTRFCELFFELSPLVGDIAKMFVPRWNGEDIFMAMVARATGGLMGNLLPRDGAEHGVTEIGSPTGISQHAGHLELRTLMLRASHRRLTCLGAKL